jgi:hypothetical protein
MLRLEVTIRMTVDIGLRFCRLNDVEKRGVEAAPNLRLHNRAGIRETRLPIPSLPVISGDGHVAVRLLT